MTAVADPARPEHAASDPAPRRNRASLRRIPRAALVCALVAVLNSAAWAFLLPPLQGHDEQAHVYYAQLLAEKGKVPRPIGQAGMSFSDEQTALANGLHLFDVIGNENGRPPWTNAERHPLDEALAANPSRKSKIGGDEGVGAYTPLYYTVAAVAYKVASGGDLIDRIVAMRLVSALLAGVTVLFVFLFLRELLPRHRWVWPVGALAVAFQPVFAYISGVVNPDAGLAAASAATFYLLARAFRRGITPGLGAALGLTVALGILAKITMVSLVPGVALGVLLLLWRAYRERDRRPWLTMTTTAAAFALPIAVYCVVNTQLWDRPLLPGGGGGGGVGGVVTGATGVGGPQTSLGGYLSYLWQDYLPRLPSMYHWFNGYNGYDVWFKSFWGAFGWGDYGFSDQALHYILYASIVLVIGALVAAFGARRAWRSWLGPLLTYAAMIVGLLSALAYVGYGLRPDTTGFEQGRYLLPLLAPLAAIVALGAVGAGRRFGRFVGVLVVVGSIGLTFYAHLLTIARFYA